MNHIIHIFLKTNSMDTSILEEVLIPNSDILLFMKYKVDNTYYCHFPKRNGLRLINYM